MSISITDLSSYIGVTPATIDRWVRQGKIPVSRRKDNYRFDIKEVEKWALRQNIKLNYPGNEQNQGNDNISVKLSAAVSNGGIYHLNQAEDKKGVIAASIKQMENIPTDFKQDLLERIMEREEAMSTGIGNGIAIPHPRDPLGYLPHPMVMVCFLNTPVDYLALDGRPVSILFFLFSTVLTVHLPLLSSLSQCLKNDQFLAILKSKPKMDVLVREIEKLEA